MRPTPRIRYPWLLGHLNHRRLEPELMDQARLPEDEHRHALDGLKRLNRAGRAPEIIWRYIKPLIDASDEEPVILDLGCGDGDLLRALDIRAAGRITPVGVDMSDTAIRLATELSPSRFEFIRHNILDPKAARILPQADIVTCSLLLHHLAETETHALLKLMNGLARRRVIISDLHRSWAGWWGIWLAARVLTRSKVVHIDSAISVNAAFRAGELLQSARSAGIEHVCVDRHFPFRLVLWWDKDPDSSTDPDQCHLDHQSRAEGDQEHRSSGR
jgi:2-polyprenyl-3-methyl-5-hydroxy-6-metoxy-1,4-benzoquinol methylase